MEMELDFFGIWISRFVLMHGEYDPLLKWAFEYNISLILVDQDHQNYYHPIKLAINQLVKAIPQFPE